MTISRAWLKLYSACLLLGLLCLQACTGMHQSRTVSNSLDERLPASVELTETPFIAQTRHQCGPASLATVLQTHGVTVSAEELIPYLFVPAREGSLQIEIAVTARRHGMLPYPLAPALSDMLEEIAAGNPVLVLQNLGFDWWPQWHYAVAIGYNIPNRQLVLRSGTTERWETDFKTFEKTWDRAENWALVIVPAGSIPETARTSSYLNTAYAFEQTGLTDYALTAYRAATRQWPDAAASWLALGNLAYTAGQTSEAVSAMISAANITPESPTVWNNLAYALHRQGCTAQAMESLQCARSLSPENKNIRDSEHEINSMPLQARSGKCPAIHCNQR